MAVFSNAKILFLVSKIFLLCGIMWLIDWLVAISNICPPLFITALCFFVEIAR